MVRRRRCVAAAAAALLLSGCQASVSTSVTVRSPKLAVIVADVRFDGEAAKALRERPAVRAQLERVLADRAGGPATSDDADGALSYRVDVPYERLASSAGVLGISGAQLTPVGSHAATLSLDVQPATELDAQLQQSVQGDPDPRVLLDTLRDSVQIRTVVIFPGGVDRVSGSFPEVRADGDRAVLVRRTDDPRSGTLTVQGSTRDRTRTLLLGGVLLTAVVVAAGTVVLRRRP